VEAEQSEFQTRAEKTYREYGERFLDTVAIQTKLGNGALGTRIADDSED
jgi:hypothetical protein